MKTNIRAAMLLSTFAVVLAFTSASFAQMVGGYKVVSKTDAGVIAAAEFAIDAQSEKSDREYSLEDVVKAERQVVQGSNYRLCMEVSADGSDTFFILAVVYADLKNNRTLRSWADSDCGDSAASTPEGTSPAADGYVPIEKTHAGANLAARFAVKEKSKTMKPGFKFNEIVKAEIKEGTGSAMGSAYFRNLVKVTRGRDEPSFAEVVVSMDQYSNFELVSWTDKSGDN